MYNFDYVDKNMLNDTKEASKKSYLLEANLTVQNISNGYILPFNNIGGGVVTSDYNYIDSSFVHNGVGSSYKFDENSVIKVDDTVVYIGMFNLIWGHCITDNLKHLWFLLDEKFAYLRNYKFVYLNAYGGDKFGENFKEILYRLGVSQENIMTVTSVTQFKNVIIPDQCFIYNKELNQTQYTKEYKQIINKISLDISPSSCDKIYFTRTLFNSKKDYVSGEKKIERILEKKGYKIISPEKLSLVEEISLLKGCSDFVTTDGSLSHNAVFLNDGSTLVIIRKANYQNRYQSAINKLNKTKIVYIDSNKSIMTNKDRPWEGPFFVYPNKNFCSYFDEKYDGFPIFSFLKYVISFTARFLLRFIKGIIRKVFSYFL